MASDSASQSSPTTSTPSKHIRLTSPPGQQRAGTKPAIRWGAATASERGPGGWLPGVAWRFRVSEADLRRSLFEETGGMYPELVTRSDIEVMEFPVYSARKRQVGGDNADTCFLRTECVAGVQDMRFQELMPDVLHWLGIRKIHRLVNMSNDKYDAITHSGIEVGERVRIPDELVPADAHVEIDAKIAAGCFTDGAVPSPTDLAGTKGRGLE